jgi:hypothetical protein
MATTDLTGAIVGLGAGVGVGVGALVGGVVGVVVSVGCCVGSAVALAVGAGLGVGPVIQIVGAGEFPGSPVVGGTTIGDSPDVAPGVGVAVLGDWAGAEGW